MTALEQAALLLVAVNSLIQGIEIRRLKRRSRDQDGGT